MALRELFTTKLFSDANLTHYYRFEADGSDSKGSNTLSNINTVAFNAALFGNGANYGANTSKHFTSTTDVITYAQRTAFTIVMWLNTTGNTTGQAIGWIRATDGTNLFQCSLGYFTANLSGFSFSLFPNGAAGTTQLNYNITIPNNTWVHLAFSYNGTSMKIYYNGSLANSVAYTYGTFATNSQQLFLGTDQGSSNQWLGLWDDLAFFSRALTDAEVAGIYIAGNLLILGTGT